MKTGGKRRSCLSHDVNSKELTLADEKKAEHIATNLLCFKILSFQPPSVMERDRFRNI